MPFSFIRCLVKYTLKFGGDTLACGVPVGSIASSIFEEWCGSGEQAIKAAPLAPPPVEQARLRAELETIVQDVRTYRIQVDQLLGEMGVGQPEAVRQAARTYLNQLPGRVQSSLRRPEDPSGRTVPAGLILRRVEDLKQLLPERMPRFQPGARPVPGTDLVIQDLIGVGGFGEVWKAIHQSRPHAPPVALKFCLDETAARTLRKEVELLDRISRQVRHPGIVELRYAHLECNPPCLEYEYVDGGDLATLVTDIHRAGKGSPLTMTRLFYLLARAVGVAHRTQPPIVHRDLKPANVLTTRIDKNIVLKVLDFGIGGLAADQIQQAMLETTSHDPLTQSSGACTPLYASPQQRRGNPPDLRDDVYALGVIWYQMLAGDATKEPPRGGSWKKRLLDQGMTPKMIALLESCLEDDPTDRPTDAHVLAEELRAVIKEAMPATQPAAGPLPPSEEPEYSARQGKQDSSISSAQLAAGAPVSNSESRELATVADILNKDPRWEVVARKRDYLDFVPKEWLEWLPQLGINAASRSWIYVCLHSEEGRRLYYSVEVAPLKDLAKRIEIVTKLLDECPRFGFKRPKRSNDKEVKNNRSRISTVESILEWEKEAEPKPELIRSAVKKTLDDLYPKLENLTSILKPLCERLASTT